MLRLWLPFTCYEMARSDEPRPCKDNVLLQVPERNRPHSG
nr:MAG TPA: hypothetical protein [Caudoviricetes sp.]DAH64852.1 MAG TPA: hypothetical protein [Caudoviricetes sp.]